MKKLVITLSMLFIFLMTVQAKDAVINFIHFDEDLILVFDGELVIKSSANPIITIESTAITVNDINRSKSYTYTLDSRDPIYFSIKYKGRVYFETVNLTHGSYIYLEYKNGNTQIHYFDKGALNGIF